MGKHHHHPHEGHGSGNPPKSRPLHHDWRFYAAGLLILVALVIYLATGDLAFRPHPAAAVSPAPATSASP